MINRKNRKVQKSYRLLSRKSGQEEMVGFALIIILVAIIFLVFLSVYVKKPQSEDIDNPEANSFVQSFLQYTTTCEEENMNNLSVQRLISRCQEKKMCSYDKEPCKILNDTIKNIINESWKVGPTNYVKGYSLIINVGDKQFLNVTKGVVTNNYKTGQQDIPNPKEESTLVLFYAYT